jgi:Protein of unknown function (DUF2905)
MAGTSAGHDDGGTTGAANQLGAITKLEFAFGSSIMQRWLIAIGALVLLLGLLWPYLAQLGLGRLPGDIVIERDNFRLYFPIVTCVVISVVLSAILWLINR